MTDLPAPDPITEFDREAALINLGGDESLLSEVVGLFLDDCPRLLGAIKEAIGHADTESLKRLAHTVRGVASNFALPAVVEAARVLESKANAGEWDGVIDCLNDLRHALDRVRPALEDLASVRS